MRILITGMAGFIGYHLTEFLASQGHTITGIDNLNNYYDPKLKLARLAELGISNHTQGKIVKSVRFAKLEFQCSDIADYEITNTVVSDFKPEIIIHLAAQAGVRYSLENPEAYIQSNIKGFFNIIELCRKHDIKRLIYASSSSVYGNKSEVPFREVDRTDSPVSLYAATKKSNELFAHTYAHLFGINAIGLRFFTVYGPYGRPDMAYFSFVKHILENKSIKVFNAGNLSRDFTYVLDIVTSIGHLVAKFDQIELFDHHRILNIGNSKPIQLKDFIWTIEQALGKKAIMEHVGMQSGDVYNTYADVTALSELINFKPITSLEEGIFKFVNWYKSYYGSK